MACLNAQAGQRPGLPVCCLEFLYAAVPRGPPGLTAAATLTSQPRSQEGGRRQAAVGLTEVGAFAVRLGRQAGETPGAERSCPRGRPEAVSSPPARERRPRGPGVSPGWDRRKSCSDHCCPRSLNWVGPQVLEEAKRSLAQFPGDPEGFRIPPAPSNKARRFQAQPGTLFLQRPLQLSHVASSCLGPTSTHLSKPLCCAHSVPWPGLLVRPMSAHAGLGICVRHGDFRRVFRSRVSLGRGPQWGG